MPVIVVVGSINMDLVVRAPRHPAPGETILGTGFATFPGGKGSNQAVAAARMDAQVRMIGRVGGDDFSSSMLATLQQDRVDTRFVQRTQDQPTGVALITVSESGQNSIVVVPGANAALSPADIRAAEAAFDGADVVIAQLEIPVETVLAAAQIASEHGAVFLLNPAPAQDLPPELMMLVDILIPNQQELAQLTGAAPDDPASRPANLRDEAALVVTLGDDGVLVVIDGLRNKIPPFAVHPVDTTAAGDAFVGAFAVALAEGKTVLQAAQWGNAAGSLAVTKAGAQPSLPTHAQLQTFLAQLPANASHP